MSIPGENEKPRATPAPLQAPEGRPAERLEWQSELDSAMADLDSRLKHPRRRASDAPQPMLPKLGQIDVTSELLDEIAWRVSQQMHRAQQAAPPQGEMVVTAADLAHAPPPPVQVEQPPRLPHGVALTIRFRRPLFRWRFWRRSRRQAMISFSDYRVT